MDIRKKKTVSNPEMALIIAWGAQSIQLETVIDNHFPTDAFRLNLKGKH